MAFHVAPISTPALPAAFRKGDFRGGSARRTCLHEIFRLRLVSRSQHCGIQFCRRLTNIGTELCSYARQGQETHHLIGTLSWVKGTHEFKFGAEGRLHRLNFTQPNYAPGGNFNFDQTGTANYDPACIPAPDVNCPPLGGDGMASFLIGAQPNDCCGQYEIPNSVASQNFEFGGFVQDNWKKSDKLTLNLGLRYEVVMPRTERHNELNWLDPNVESPITLDGKHLLGGERFANSSDRYSYAPDYKNIQPRFGFAYRPFHNTVVRGGYGIYFSAWRGRLPAHPALASKVSIR